MKKVKKLIQPLFFILITSLLTGALLFFHGPAPGPGGADHGNVHPAPEYEPAAPGDSGALAYKNETVYVMLDPGGKVIEQRIVNRIYCCDSDEKGMVSDYGRYENISNMTSEAEPVLQDDTILWNSELLREGDIYYEGTTDKSLPVDFELDYYLDGDMIEAKDLTGKSGKLKIVIKVKNNLTVEGAVAYRDYYGDKTRKYETNYVPLLVQGTYMADLNRFSEITASDGMGIVTGQNMNVSFMAFPYPETEIIITMQGKDIELNQIMMVIVPQLPPIPEIDMEDDLQKMLDGVIAIEEGLTAIYEGADELYKGLDLFRNMSNEMLSEMEPLLTLMEDLPGFIDKYFSENEEFFSRLEELLKYFEDLPWDLPESPGHPGELPEFPEIPEELPDLPALPEIPELPGALPELPEGLLEELTPYLEAMKSFTERFDDLEQYFTNAEEIFEQLAALPEALNQLADGQKAIRDGIGEINNRGIMEMKKGLIDGINENRYGQAKIDLMRSLAEGYKSHADNKNNIKSSVQFILQTESINEQNRPAEEEDYSEGDNEPGSKDNSWFRNLWSRFLGLFIRTSLG